MIPTNPRWRIEPLGEVVDVLDSRRVPVNAKERADRQGVVPYYGAAGQVGWIDESLFNEPLVLLGEDGVQFFDPGKAKAYLIDGPAWVNNHAHVLRARPAIDRKFLNYYLNAADYRGFANGTTRLKLTQTAMNRIPVPLPEPSEQRRIVDLLEDHLSRLDAAEDYIEATGSRAENWHAGLVSRMLWSPDYPTAEVGALLREPMRNGRSDRAAQGSEAGTRTLTLTAVTQNAFTEENTKLTITPAGRAAGLWLECGDVFVQRSNTPELVGTTARYKGPSDWAIFPDLLIRLRVDESKVDSRFLTAALRSEQGHSQFRRKAKGLAGSMPKIDQAAVAATVIPAPDLAEQVRMLQQVERATAALNKLRAELDRVYKRRAALGRSLLAAAFSGRLLRSDSRSGLSVAEEMIGA